MATGDKLLRKPVAAVSTRLVSVLRYTRLQLALKAAVAVGLAWFVATRVPGDASQYPYYAPLGAIVSMYPTVAGTLRTGLQTLVGLVSGIALALIALLFGGPTTLSIALIAGLGVLLAGIPRLGAGKDYLPVAALFVLVLGGSDPGTYSFAYTVQMGIGVVIGLTVNAVLFPPLHLNGAVDGLASLRMALAAQLREMGTALQEQWPPEHEDWAGRRTRLIDLSRQVRSAVQLADSSRRGNLRSRRHQRDLTADFRSLRAMERCTLYVEDMTEVLADAIWHHPHEVRVPAGITDCLAEGLLSAAAAMEAWDQDSNEYREALAALERLGEDIAREAARGEPTEASAALAMGLRRILRMIAAREEQP